ncbi:hypothetical protein SAMN05444172_4308 [Burkholderia sp. GAS332]|nr:hypothetical protein SAMN05444172_4308 [Burkholderia sp. GAS332]
MPHPVRLNFNSPEAFYRIHNKKDRETIRDIASQLSVIAPEQYWKFPEWLRVRYNITDAKMSTSVLVTYPPARTMRFSLSGVQCEATFQVPISRSFDPPGVIEV